MVDSHSLQVARCQVLVVQRRIFFFHNLSRFLFKLSLIDPRYEADLTIWLCVNYAPQFLAADYNA